METMTCAPGLAAVNCPGSHGAAQRLLLALALFGVALAAPRGVDARGGAATAVYVNGFDLSTGLIHIQGDGFTPRGQVEVWVYDDSLGYATDPSDHQIVTARRERYRTDCPEGERHCHRQTITTGLIDLYSGPYCPRVLSIVAVDVTTGTVVSTTFTNSDRPW
jgi:hypothetical protein